ncbi:MAG: ABC transporter ATP-binding protein [Clostridia bacterium]|nr:ABC transporter ATP-binding protein [Clostridia bacterium]
MLEIKNVTKYYGWTRALSDVTLTLPRGQIVGLFGENGAGKTTLMKSILGYLPCRGSIVLDGAPITRHNIDRFSFATCEHSYFPELTPLGHRDFYAAHFPRFSEKRFSGLMDFFELPRTRALRSFSTGQKNQFEVIMALSQGADYILMDEPFAANDIFNREDFYRLLVGLLEPHETVLLSTHLVAEVADFIGRAVLLHHGRLVGDIGTDDLDDGQTTLVEKIKQVYHYRADRVGRTLGKLTDDESL